ncbi:MAG TPA: phosphosulfolactate synthase [Anaerolineae bacterium]|nr:phosphosulfolactate synthase [Anaerolineae bacterium]
MTQPKAWDHIFEDGFYARTHKPRTVGLNMVIDKHLGIRAMADLLELAGDSIDQIKFAFGTSIALNETTVRSKIEMIRAQGIDVYPGGTLCEAAIVRGVVPQFIARSRELGFSAVEVSDGTITLSPEARCDVISRALDAGLKVISEVGKKDPRHQLAIDRMQAEVAADLAIGASYVIIEARESGKGVGIYDATGAVNQTELDALVAGFEHLDRIIWEAPETSQQAFLLNRFGLNVNLGNIQPNEVLALEALRSGLRFETLRLVAAERERAEQRDDFFARFIAAASSSIGR